MNNNNFQVTWKNACHICARPLDLIVISQACEKFLLKLTIYMELNPLDLRTNKSEFKFVSGEKKARKVCRHCRTNKIDYRKLVFARECNRSLPAAAAAVTRNPTKTAEQIVEWFEMLNRFFRRSDWDQHITSSISSRVANIGNTVLRDDQFEIFFNHYVV
jgi:hypothetical protein